MAIVLNVFCGVNHTVALTEDGSLYGWGFNASGSLGIIDNNTHQNTTIINRDSLLKSIEAKLFLKGFD